MTSITIVAVNAQKNGTKKYFDNSSLLFDPKNDGYKTVYTKYIENLSELDDIPVSDIIIFHPRATEKNPKWKGESLNFMDIPIEHFEGKHLIFGADNGNIMEKIEREAPRLKECRFVKVPVSKGTRSFHAHIGASIVLWERFKKMRDPSNYDFFEW